MFPPAILQRGDAVPVGVPWKPKPESSDPYPAARICFRMNIAALESLIVRPPSRPPVPMVAAELLGMTTSSQCKAFRHFGRLQAFLTFGRDLHLYRHEGHEGFISTQ